MATSNIQIPQFSEDACALKDLSKQALILRAEYGTKALELQAKIKAQFKQFTKATNHDHSFNLCKNRMNYQPQSLNANDITMNGKNFIFFACPRDVNEASALFDAVLQKGGT